MSTLPDDQHADRHDPLRALAHVTDRSVPPVASLHRRAAQIRRGRRRTTVLTSAGALAVAVAVGGVLLPPSPPPTPAGPRAASFIGLSRAQAGDGTATCVEDGYGVNLDRDDWQDDPRAAELAAWLPAQATGEPVRGVNVHTDGLTCVPPVPAAVLFTETPVTTGLTLWAGVARPFDGETGLRTLTVRGVTAELLPLRGNLMLTWREPDGTRWVAQGSGLSEAEIVRNLDALVLDGATVDPAGVPEPWVQSALPDVENSWTDWVWSVEYGPDGYTQDPPGFVLEVAHEVEPVAVAAARSSDLVEFTRVGGQLATFWTDQGGCVTWDASGLAYSLCGSQDVDLLVSLAEQVEPVSTTDPRIASAPDLH